MNNPAVHNTGGAIDLTLAHKASGKALDMGTEFDEISLKHTGVEPRMVLNHQFGLIPRKNS